MRKQASLAWPYIVLLVLDLFGRAQNVCDHFGHEVRLEMQSVPLKINLTKSVRRTYTACRWFPPS